MRIGFSFCPPEYCSAWNMSNLPLISVNGLGINSKECTVIWIQVDHKSYIHEDCPLRTCYMTNGWWLTKLLVYILAICQENVNDVCLISVVDKIIMRCGTSSWQDSHNCWDLLCCELCFTKNLKEISYCKPFILSNVANEFQIWSKISKPSCP